MPKRHGIGALGYNAGSMSTVMIHSPRITMARCGATAHGASFLVLAVAMAPLLVAAGLDPSASGVGTHRQLGLPACGFLVTTAVPCATCGMTTAFALAARGDLATAVMTQPAGALLALAAAAAVLVSAYALVAGLSLSPLARVLWRPRPVLIVAGFAVVSWAYKIAIFHAGS